MEDDRNLTDFNLSLRTVNCLASANITTVGTLANASAHRLLKIPNLGKTSLREVGNFLRDLGIDWDKRAGQLPDDPVTVAIRKAHEFREACKAVGLDPKKLLDLFDGQ